METKLKATGIINREKNEKKLKSTAAFDELKMLMIVNAVVINITDPKVIVKSASSLFWDLLLRFWVGPKGASVFFNFFL
jgi:hypothetical protein